ncbi:MAG TPA: hypothetical protein PLY85_11805 [Anaerolineaceae bacterium]|nr:hypothetical protein [Anaerolineaceae bacterium]
MTVHHDPAVIQKHPDYLRWQALIRSHPDGVEGVPLAAGEFPGRLVLIDCSGHKLVFLSADTAEQDGAVQGASAPQGRHTGRRAGR